MIRVMDIRGMPVICLRDGNRVGYVFGPMFDENECLTGFPVSYTHLDVYKRQVYGGGGGQGRGYNRGDGKSSKRRRITPEEGAALPKDAEGCDIILGKAITDPITPVSYTHLCRY